MVLHTAIVQIVYGINNIYVLSYDENEHRSNLKKLMYQLTAQCSERCTVIVNVL